MTIIELYRDGALYFTAVLNSSNDWMYSFNNLPEGNYKIKENEIPDYTVSYSVSGETVTVMHTLNGGNVQQLPVSTNMPSPVSTQYSDSASVAASPEPVLQPGEAVEPTTVPTTAGVPEQAVPQQNAQIDENNLSEFVSSDKQSSNLMLLVGILGGAGVLCAAVAVYLIRKMK
jgi:hypothetical protein